MYNLSSCETLVCSFLCKTRGTARAHAPVLLSQGLLNTSVLVAHTLPIVKDLRMTGSSGDRLTCLLVGLLGSVIAYEAVLTEKSSPRKHPHMPGYRGSSSATTLLGSVKAEMCGPPSQEAMGFQREGMEK